MRGKMAVLYILLVLIVLAGLYILAVMPRRESKTSLEPLKTDYAHRGLFDADISENTMPAFMAASRAGYGIELDIQLSADGEVVVFHDDTLERLCGRPEKVSDLTAAELSWVGITGSCDRIPLFEDVLARVDKDTPLLIELKGYDVALCEKAAAMLDDYDGYYCIESFNPLLLNWFRKNRPRCVRGQLTANLLRVNKKGNFFVNLIATPMLLNFLSRPDFIASDIAWQNSLPVKICTKMFGAPLFLWTVDTPEKYFAAVGTADAVIFQDIKPEPRQKKAK